MKSIISRGSFVLESLFKTFMIVSVSSPTDTAAYKEWGVRLYSCIDSGLHKKWKWSRHKNGVRSTVWQSHRLPTDGLSNGDEEIICLLVEGREGLQKYAAVSASPQRAVGMVGFQLQLSEVPLLSFPPINYFPRIKTSLQPRLKFTVQRWEKSGNGIHLRDRPRRSPPPVPSSPLHLP